MQAMQAPEYLGVVKAHQAWIAWRAGTYAKNYITEPRSDILIMQVVGNIVEGAKFICVMRVLSLLRYGAKSHS